MNPDDEGIHRIANTDKPDRAVDVVFIHGLAGGSHTTWRHGREGGAERPTANAGNWGRLTGAVVLEDGMCLSEA